MKPLDLRQFKDKKKAKYEDGKSIIMKNDFTSHTC